MIKSDTLIKVKTKSPYERPCLLASLPLSDNYPCDIFRGLMKFSHETQRFAIRFHDQERHRLEDLVDFSLTKAVVGIVVYGCRQELMEEVRLLGLPAVNVSNAVADPGLPSVLVDNVKVGASAAAHLLRKGYDSQIFLHHPELEFSRKRLAGWESKVKEAGGHTHVIEFTDFHQVMSELEKTDRPAGLVGATDHLARSVLDRSLNVGWSVPGELAIVGCSNNDLVCEGGLVSLSSVPISGESVGLIAAKTLVQMLDGGKPPSAPILVDPGEVVERESTDLIRQAEPTIADAIRFIRTHACSGIQIPHVLEATGLSRATLDRQVKKLLGHSPHTEIKRLQIDRAKHLLANTHYPLAEVAAQCGFKEPNYFMRVFREEIGRTPTEFRRDILSKASR